MPKGEQMGVFGEIEAFVRTHRPCGNLNWITAPPTLRGYLVRVTCPCGVVFERWVLPQDAEEDLVLSRLRGFPN